MDLFIALSCCYNDRNRRKAENTRCCRQLKIVNTMFDVIRKFKFIYIDNLMILFNVQMFFNVMFTYVMLCQASVRTGRSPVLCETNLFLFYKYHYCL